MHLSTFSVLALLVSAQSLPNQAAQAPLPGDPGNVARESLARESEYGRVQRELGLYRARFGSNWQAHFDHETGWAQLVFGGARSLDLVPANDPERFAAARVAIDETRGMTGIDSRVLVDDSVAFLPLSLAGSCDKLSVQFRQEVRGVPVVHGYVNVLLDLQGRVLAVDSTGLPELGEAFDVTPTITGGRAVDVAAQTFADTTRLAPRRVVGPTLVIAQPKSPKLRTARLAWQVEVHWDDGQGAAEGYTYWIDARTGESFAHESAVHEDVSGTVNAKATPGFFPDSTTNAETAQAMPYLTVTSSQGNATTAANGSFTIVGATAPVSATFKFNGTYCTVTNQGGSAYTQTQSLTSASGNAVTMNNTVNDLVTAQANVFQWVGKMRDWTRSVNPTDATSDFLATANVNIVDVCNAYYDGVSVNFYQPGGGCVNTSYSTVVLHEMGHWLNTRYFSGNGGDGFGEGNADNFTTFHTDDPIVGRDFGGVGSYIRDANNTRQFCGDNFPACYGEVHADGEVLMGACWKVRSRLKTAYGNALGIQKSNTLFNAWMNGFNDGQIKTIVRTHWLVLDDDNGNIDDGTPNFAHINGGFVDQGFPTYVFQAVSFSNVTQLPNTQDQTGPYVVTSNVFANTNPPITTASIKYRVNGGAFSTAAMSFVSGVQWSGSIPGIASPSVVEYYVTATDNAAHTNVYPANAPTGLLKFKIGAESVFYSEGFESGTNGWTHGQIATQDDWQLSSVVGGVGAAGKSGDPTAAYAGQNIWGNDLGFGTFNGAYTDNVSNWLRSPTINLSGKTGCTLKLQRWLTVESGQYDQAKIKINGTQVWVNDFALDTLDTAWTEAEVDISSLADNNPSVQIEFSLQSDGGLTYGGWNIDDVRIVALTAVCGPPSTTQPSNVTTCPGSSANFATTAGGVGPFTYQWKKNGSPIGGATASNYSIASVAAGDAGSYTCVVTNGCSSSESAAGVLAVNTATTASALSNQTACPGGGASFSTTASGTGPFTYQWKKNGATIGGATASSFSLTNVQASDAATYSVVVTGACNAVTPSATLTVNTATTATTPSSQTVCPGGGASFATVASGTGPFTYQWKKNGSPIGGATASSLSLTNVQASDAATYSVAVSGACNSVEPSASLTVNTAVGATSPSNQTVCAGSTANFATTASGTGPFTYQWKKDGSPIGGATSSSYSLANAQAGDAGTYSVLVTGACGSTEPAATLTINAASGATGPNDQTVCAGSGASFSTTATGTGPFTYQWKKNGNPLGGETASTLNLASAQASDAGTYSVVVAGACGSVENFATLTINVAPSATTPNAQVACPGGGASFSTTASGAGPFTYQWKKDGNALAGATASTLTLANVQASDAGTYSVLVTGSCGSTEPSATLSVPTPVSASEPSDEIACAGETVSFSTTPSGDGPFTYQWKKNGVALPGETASTLVLASVVAADSGTYSVAVVGACGTAEPDAVLSVYGTTTNYCTSKQNTLGLFPTIGSTGTPGATANDFVLTLSNALPNKNALAFWGVQPLGAPFNGGHLCVKAPLIRLTVKKANASGFASVTVPVDNSMIGATRYYQWWARDITSSFGISLSDGLAVTFCD
ncbi:MAG: immunoglobulin domain-containing protein [Planctomycetes bacterium]|nr:immunoglobulin domain-containing protein [Planctomycetota bacterium]